MCRVWRLCLYTLLCHLLVRVESLPQNESIRSLRLPNTTFPISYKLQIKTNLHLDQFEYDGYVIIEVEVQNSTDEIVLHAKNLTDFEIKVHELPSGKIKEDLTHTYDSHGSFLIIHPKNKYLAFENGRHYIVEIGFKGVMNSHPNGIYWLNYIDSQNQTTYIAATQFEATGARLAFPCFDEPSRKATFRLSITHGNMYNAISNMPVLSKEESQQNSSTTTFQITPPISTYLVAFVIYRDFNYISEQYRGIEHRLYTKNQTTEQGRDTLKRAIKTLIAFEDYFDVKFPLPKLDHIGLNKIYGVAMENWGLITYQEDTFVRRNGKNKIFKQMMAINHEVAHQWFGNLVSPEWWTYAWMNEGFATYFAYALTDLLHPDFKAMEFFNMEISNYAYSYNEIETRPMSYYVESEDQIRSIFDPISYKKAACVIKMFHFAFNQKTFVSGISGYLKKWQYATANEAQLFKSIETAVKQDPILSQQPWVDSVQEIMASWTQTEGIPTLVVTRNQSDNTVTIKKQTEDRKWIPLNFATKSRPNFENTSIEYFMPPVSEVKLNLSDFGIHLREDDWLLLNKQHIGLYVVIYDTENQRAITNQLHQNHTKIHVLNRAAIFQYITKQIDENTIFSVDGLFDLLSYLEHEEDLLTWNYATNIISVIEKNLYGSPAHALYRDFIRRLVKPAFNRLSQKPLQDDFTSIEIIARQTILELACMTDLPECLEYTKSLTHDYIMGKVAHLNIESSYDLEDYLLSFGVKYLSEDDFNSILPLLSNADPNSQWYNDMLYSLRFMENRNNLKQYLTLLMQDDLKTHSGSIANLFFLFRKNMGASTLIFDFIESNYANLSHSTLFLEKINRFAEYIPKEYNERFLALRKLISRELKLRQAEDPKDFNEIHIDENFDRLGKKIQNKELFLMEYEKQINAWLMRYNDQYAYASAFNAHNSAGSLSFQLIDEGVKKLRSLF